MEGKFKIKFDSRESYLKGASDFLQLLSNWKETQSKYERDFSLASDVNDDEQRYNLEVSLNVNKKEIPQVV